MEVTLTDRIALAHGRWWAQRRDPREFWAAWVQVWPEVARPLAKRWDGLEL